MANTGGGTKRRSVDASDGLAGRLTAHHGTVCRDQGRVVGAVVNPLFVMRASTLGSRPRNARYASAGSTVLPIESSCLSRAATALSYGPPASVNAPYASAVITSLHRYE